MHRLIYVYNSPFVQCFSSKPQSTHFWFATAFLYPPVLLFGQMKPCLSLLRSLFQGCGQLLSGLRRCQPLGASTGNKVDLTWWTTSIETHFLVLWGGTALCRTYALFFFILFHSFHSLYCLSLCIMYSVFHILRASVSDISWLKHVLNKGCQ